MKTPMIAIAALTAALATPALANDAHSGAMAKDYFVKMDTDHNGTVTKEEHASFAQTKFDSADTNKDGALSLDELTAFKKKEKEEWKSSKVENPEWNGSKDQMKDNDTMNKKNPKDNM